MFEAIARRVFGTANERYLRGLHPQVEAINALEPELEKLSDEALRARTGEFRDRVASGEPLDDLLVKRPNGRWASATSTSSSSAAWSSTEARSRR
jgi:preprotein translocase subunit SecA